MADKKDTQNKYSLQFLARLAIIPLLITIIGVEISGWSQISIRLIIFFLITFSFIFSFPKFVRQVLDLFLEGIKKLHAFNSFLAFILSLLVTISLVIIPYLEKLQRTLPEDYTSHKEFRIAFDKWAGFAPFLLEFKNQ